jgi:pyridoxal biosynthesis lyase PdxS
MFYIDADYKCHVNNDGTMREFDSPFFAGKCDEFIEGHRFVPDGEEWVREDGEVFRGEMISAWKDYTELRIAQLEYEVEKAKAEGADLMAALEKFGVTDDE